MMRRLVLPFILAVLLLFIAAPALAFDPPTQGEDPATDVIIWPGDAFEVTVTSADVTVDMDELAAAIADAMTEAAEATAASNEALLESIMETMLPLLMVLFVVILAYWHREKWLYGVAGLGLAVYGFNSVISGSLETGIVILAAGGVTFIKAWIEKKGKSRA